MAYAQDSQLYLLLSAGMARPESITVTKPDRILVQAAARNNAEWCATVCRSHGVEGRFGPQAWTAPTRTPPLYPDAVTLVPSADAAAMVGQIDVAAPGASVKDSFADLDLTWAGFRVLFEASWLHRPAGSTVPRCDLIWGIVTGGEQLRAWARAWQQGGGDEGLFRPELLDDADTFVLAGQNARGGDITAGAVAFRSRDVVGISNLFAVTGGPDAAWRIILQAADSLFPALPVVTYDDGDGLASALRHGFEVIGPLRVWLRP